jgi:hypothetical protein
MLATQYLIRRLAKGFLIVEGQQRLSVKMPQLPSLPGPSQGVYRHRRKEQNTGCDNDTN